MKSTQDLKDCTCSTGGYEANKDCPIHWADPSKIERTKADTKAINALAREWAEYVGGFAQAQKIVAEAYDLGAKSRASAFCPQRQRRTPCGSG